MASTLSGLLPFHLLAQPVLMTPSLKSSQGLSYSSMMNNHSSTADGLEGSFPSCSSRPMSSRQLRSGPISSRQISFETACRDRSSCSRSSRLNSSTSGNRNKKGSNSSSRGRNFGTRSICGRVAVAPSPPRADLRRKGRGLSIRASATEQAESTTTVSSPPPTEAEAEQDEVEKLLGGVSFAELCDEFECVSSPAVEQTARQLAKDILEMKENQRLLSCFSVFVKFKDPLRSFTGREKYKRPSWLRSALDKPQVALLQMVARSTSQLTIRWRVRGDLRLPGASLLAGPLTLTVLSTFELNQISGQVVEHREEWELAGSSPAAAAYFWSSRLSWTVAELGRDAQEALTGIQKIINSSLDGNGGDIYADPADPQKFFQDSNPNGELYQIALLLALVYLLFQFLRLTL
eukprot:TRINITY_DN23182_c0_g1_i1.p1 TRINITY_DN23182_c0_g1~~TRINITY_DN23182_c0_g1_i1.p1  ORF type:complete len:405 (+),score=85.91 TRINITY_DN23182_c0_g1_i1:997-2211(+)